MSLKTVISDDIGTSDVSGYGADNELSALITFSVPLRFQSSLYFFSVDCNSLTFTVGNCFANLCCCILTCSGYGSFLQLHLSVQQRL